MKTLILDNYDSFTFNLYQEIGVLSGNPQVYRNDKITIEEVGAQKFTHIILGPGPGNPSVPRDIGISKELVTYAEAERIPLLGVCLGHQILGDYFCAEVIRAPEIFHGKASIVRFSSSRSKLFAELSETIESMRYHSLCVQNIKAPLVITAKTDSGIVMAMEHESLPLFGVQFHPESIGTPCGRIILKNFLSVAS